jgi:ferric-dicitrate binding protein FerR (iron transport regulator)
MKAGCFHTGILLERRKSGLSRADELVLEQHLSECERCAQEARALGAFRTLVSKAASRPLSMGGRQRAIWGAFRRAGEKHAPERDPNPRAWVLAGSLATSAAAVIAALFWLGVIGPRAEDRVLEGGVRVAARHLEGGDRIPSDEMLSAEEETTIAVAHAQVTLEAGTELQWRAKTRTIELLSHSIDVAVDPRPRQSFRVATARFSVEVLGTKFRVGERGVSVTEGAVRIRDASGAIVVEHLEAGQTWAPSPPSPAADSALVDDEGIAPAPPKVFGEDWMHDRRAARAKRKRRIHSVDPTAEAEGTQARPQELLRGARRALAEGDVKGARSILSEARAQSMSRLEDAEASTIEAECVRATGDHAEASRLYGEIVRRFADLFSGENALYCQALEEDALHHRARTIELFRVYLERYPGGRLRAEAAARLDQLRREGAP